MNDPLKIVGVVRGAPSATVQPLFQNLVARWRSDVRIAGVVSEDHGLLDRSCNAGFLRSIASGDEFSIYQDLGTGSQACHLDPYGVTAATAAIQRDIAAGCDLVVLNKFGKLEAAGAGLLDAFAMAVAARIPVLTSVSPAFEAAWTRFAAPLFEFLPADSAAIEYWWLTIRSRPVMAERDDSEFAS